MYIVEFTDTAKKQFRKLEKELQKRIISTLERIRIRPEHFLVKLVGDPGYKLRVGNHRLIMDIDQGKLILLVLRMRYRRNVYD